MLSKKQISKLLDILEHERTITLKDAAELMDIYEELERMLKGE